MSKFNYNCSLCCALEEPCGSLSCHLDQIRAAAYTFFMLCILHVKALFGRHCFHKYKRIDEKTIQCARCGEKVYSIEEPQHFNCRCVTVPILKES